MSILKTKPLLSCATPQEALAEICSGFEACESINHRDYTPVSPGQMPAGHSELLVHHEHMTHALARHHGKPVDLYVMERHHEGDLYSRKIFLTKKNTAFTVELGLVRLDLRYVAPEARAEILEGVTPLGEVLTKHNVLRRIEPRWYLHFPDGSSMMTWFGSRERGPNYGRLGTIYCNGEPAVEVLEIVTGV